MPIRVHELAKELKISTMALKKHLTDLGVITKSHMSLIEDDVANKIRLKYNEQIDAEKKAERDRKKLIEMRHAAKAKPEPDLVIPQEAIVEPETESKTEARPEPEPEPKPEPKEPEMAISQAQETPPTPAAPIKVPEKEDKPASIRQPQAERAKTLSYFDTQRKPQDSRTRTQAPTDRRPDYKKKPTEYRKPEVPIDQAAKKLAAVPVDSAKEVDKKFGKAKSTPDDLGDKSKHKKALIGGTKKSKRKVAEPAEVDEAEISRSIKKTLQKSTKKKKYHREAQVVQERINEIVIREYTSVSELAKIMNVSPSEIISKFFMLGQLVTMNQRLDRDSLEMICDEFKLDFRFEDEYGTELLERDKDSYEDVEEELRPPVVTIMGHVDHGKTSILDYIRNTNVVAGESGGITQHIGAYQIEINKHKITFLDTPGHEAFSAMRARGANVTDIAVIVVAATEGMKPQTKEAIDHAKAAGVSIIIAITKVDLPDSNIDRVIAQLLEYGVFLEQYGGEIPWCKTSVVTGEGVLNLIELIILTAELKELTAKASVPATGTVVESQKDPRKGVVVTILIKEGCLKKGDTVVCGATYGRIKKMENERGMEIKELGPSDVAIIYGLDNVPKADCSI
ncbi:MAG: translation initiation factor IF-2 [Candidatus Cloacimonetes bacterium]|nr:translation initiation factor IF-2 [Candidatus Cloacimonadota bacterium]